MASGSGNGPGSGSGGGSGNKKGNYRRRRRRRRPGGQGGKGNRGNRNASAQAPAMSTSTAVANGEPVEAWGVLETLPEGYGFLRTQKANYLPRPDDVWVAPDIIRDRRLEEGVEIKARPGPPAVGARPSSKSTRSTVATRKPGRADVTSPI
ncbi:MAG: hypothetical protein Q9Q13_10245 [Acidobacteriota bacterium]|nr:hypothetical protein [Acidobacteriota bacterium]